MNGLKEWATVVKALENGKQTVILRKGGILETDSGFNVESKEFLLFLMVLLKNMVLYLVI